MRTVSIFILDPDDTFTRRAKSAVSTSGLDVTIHRYKRFRDLAEHVVRVDGRGLLIAVITAENIATLAELKIVHEEYPALPKLLVAPSQQWLEPVHLVRTGAMDLLGMRESDDALKSALHRAVRMAQTLVPEGVEGDDEVGPGSVVSFASAVGGVGRTFLATNFAAWCVARTGESVCVVDLNGWLSSLTTALRIRPRFTVVQAARATVDLDLLHEQIDDYMVPAPDGFDVLASGDDPEEWDAIDPHSLRMMLEVIRRHYDMVIVDCLPGMDRFALEAMRLSEQIGVVSTVDIPTMRSTRLLLRAMEGLGFRDDPQLVILNKIDPKVGIDVAQAVEYLQVARHASIDVERDVRVEMNAGKVMITNRKSHPISRSLDVCFQSLLEFEGGTNGSKPNQDDGSDQGLLARLVKGKW